MGTGCPLPAADHHGSPANVRQTKEPRYIKATVKTSKDLISSSQDPCPPQIPRDRGCHDRLHLCAPSFGFSDTPPANANPHPMTVEDVDHLLDVDGPQLSPDGQWIAYTVRRVDTKADKTVTDLWMANWDGSQDIQLTYEVRTFSKYSTVES